jgi:hypothetical protein
MSQLLHTEIPPSLEPWFKALFYLFQQKYEEAKTLDFLKEELFKKKPLLPETTFTLLAQRIETVRGRIAYFSKMVLTKNLFLTKNVQSNVSEWAPLRTPTDYYQAIFFLQQEIIQLHKFVQKESIPLEKTKKRGF